MLDLTGNFTDQTEYLRRFKNLKTLLISKTAFEFEGFIDNIRELKHLKNLEVGAEDIHDIVLIYKEVPQLILIDGM